MARPRRGPLAPNSIIAGVRAFQIAEDVKKHHGFDVATPPHRPRYEIPHALITSRRKNDVAGRLHQIRDGFHVIDQLHHGARYIAHKGRRTSFLYY
jgi:hypothetical protein